MRARLECFSTRLKLEWLLFRGTQPTIWRALEHIPEGLHVDPDRQVVAGVYMAEGRLHKRNDEPALMLACVRAMRTRRVVGCVVVDNMDGSTDDPELKTVIYRLVVAPDG